MEVLTSRVLAVAALLLAAVLLMGFTWLRLELRRRFGSEGVVVQALDRALAEASIVAKDAVFYTQQVLVDKLKEQSADGKLTPHEAQQAMNLAWQYFQTHISKESVKVIEAAFGPVEAWAKSLMEAKVGENKLLESLPKAPQK